MHRDHAHEQEHERTWDDPDTGESLMVRAYPSRAAYIADRYALYQSGWLVRDLQSEPRRRWLLPWPRAGEPRLIVTYVQVQGQGQTQAQAQPQADAPGEAEVQAQSHPRAAQPDPGRTPATNVDEQLQALAVELQAVRRERDWERAQRQRSEAERNSLRAELAALQAEQTRPGDQRPRRPREGVREGVIVSLRDWVNPDEYVAARD